MPNSKVSIQKIFFENKRYCLFFSHRNDSNRKSLFWVSLNWLNFGQPDWDWQIRIWALVRDLRLEPSGSPSYKCGTRRFLFVLCWAFSSYCHGAGQTFRNAILEVKLRFVRKSGILVVWKPAVKKSNNYSRLKGSLKLHPRNFYEFWKEETHFSLPKLWKI